MFTAVHKCATTNRGGCALARWFCVVWRLSAAAVRCAAVGLGGVTAISNLSATAASPTVPGPCPPSATRVRPKQTFAAVA